MSNLFVLHYISRRDMFHSFAPNLRLTVDNLIDENETSTSPSSSGFVTKADYEPLLLQLTFQHFEERQSARAFIYDVKTRWRFPADVAGKTVAWPSSPDRELSHDPQCMSSLWPHAIDSCLWFTVCGWFSRRKTTGFSTIYVGLVNNDFFIVKS